MTEIQQKFCQICNSSDEKFLRPASLVSEQIIKLIEQNQDWNPNAWICANDLNRLRNIYVENLIREEKGEISDLEKTVLQSLNSTEILTTNLDAFSDKNLSRWERVADQLAEFGGSWAFIVLFLLLIAIWVVLNSVFLIEHRFDPYPFIFLNLLLSCIAAIQAPIIMMSQNRQAARDQQKALQDYQVNLKAELEIRELHHKIDNLLIYHWQRLLEIQKVQTELMNELQQK
jgi:uncharacterized membrane protein